MTDISFVQAIVIGIGLVLILEGLLYAAFPHIARKMVELMAQTGEQDLRKSGLIAAVIGLFIIWLVK